MLKIQAKGKKRKISMFIIFKERKVFLESFVIFGVIFSIELILMKQVTSSLQFDLCV
jgi:hypothetical protein